MSISDRISRVKSRQGARGGERPQDGRKQPGCPRRPISVKKRCAGGKRCFGRYRSYTARMDARRVHGVRLEVRVTEVRRADRLETSGQDDAASALSGVQPDHVGEINFCGARAIDHDFHRHRPCR